MPQEARGGPGRDRVVRRNRHRQVGVDQRPGRPRRGPGRRPRRLDQRRLARRVGRVGLLRARIRSIASRADRHAGHQRGRRRPAGRDGPRRRRAGRPDSVRHRFGFEPDRIRRAGASWPPATSRSCWCSTRSTTTRRQQRQQLREALGDSGLRGIVEPDDVVETAADPLPREYVIESPDGSTRSEYRQRAAPRRGAQGADSGSARARRQGAGGAQRRHVRRRPQRPDRGDQKSACATSRPRPSSGATRR